MSLEEVREQNKKKVIQSALRLFVKHGIDNAKIAEIAAQAGLTERSVYRYFNTKSDLVLAAALLFWQSNVVQAKKLCEQDGFDAMTGAEQIESVLLAYTKLFYTEREKLIFVDEAEIFLYKSGGRKRMKTIPPLPFDHSRAPLAMAIQKGLADGTVSRSRESDIELLYYNTYDALVGLMQKVAMSEGSDARGISAEKRLTHFCGTLTAAFLAP
ncbi:MAG: helix-turn-helix domain-containing protein [Ruthenibacterium sp.]